MKRNGKGGKKMEMRREKGAGTIGFIRILEMWYGFMLCLAGIFSGVWSTFGEVWSTFGKAWSTFGKA
jgi:hypothetical protein